ncbi:MAG: bifunctional response regulator/alkaline phosphatase family protein [Bacteroidales bacterium]|nr:bifunctional response regulator/alkaline phosphatase family protein [Bacteroidales bacterium]
MQNHILWVDDEVDLLKPHIMFLQQKGYDIVTVTNGHDAITLVQQQRFDLVFLDENMPGITGLETLQAIKEIHPSLPVVMVTKSEEENIMDQAIGSKIADYLIKPMLPSQMLMSIKKCLHANEITHQQQTTGFQQEFGKIADSISEANSFESWCNIYKKIVHWELEFTGSRDRDLLQILLTQKYEANATFSKFVRRNYETWITLLLKQQKQNRPTLSPDIFGKYIIPQLETEKQVFFVVIDNFRLDQWRSIQTLFSQWFDCHEDLYCSILPTATQYARNALFSALMPAQIEQQYPNLWLEENEENCKNQHEAELLQTLLNRYRINYSFTYNKINEDSYCNHLLAQFGTMCRTKFNVIVINFLDMLSHAGTDNKVVSELAHDEAAFRALTRTWFEHSNVYKLFCQIAKNNSTVILTTDHGTTRVDNAIKIIGDKTVNNNLRYKMGKNLNWQSKNVFEISHPKNVGLPTTNLSSSYAFCSGRDFFVYPNNYNHYVQYYKNTFQHGGISMEEMLIPIITLTPKQ